MVTNNLGEVKVSDLLTKSPSVVSAQERVINPESYVSGTSY
jgi:hypothetical protein